jgi:flagellar hook-associated protein 3
MAQRVTLNSMVNFTLSQMQRQFATLGKYQTQAATGLRLQRPSDDPVDMVTVLANKSQNLRFESFLANIRDARLGLNTTTATLQDASGIMTQVRRIATEGAQATNDANSYQALAQEVDALLTRMIDLGNTRGPDGYLFAGTATQTKPFEIASSNTDGKPATIVYRGAAERTQAIIGIGTKIDIGWDGPSVFQQRSRGATVYSGTTGAAAGTGTDSGTGQATLLVRHTTTTYAAGSGVTAGSSSASSDTIIAPAGVNNLTIVDTSGTGSGGTVSINNGPATAWTSSDVDLKVVGPAGETVYVNMSNITAGFSGTVSITANGELSTDDGLTTTAITFAANQVVTNSLTGEVTNVNTTNIRSAGKNFIDYQGTYDVFQLLMALRDDLRNTRGLTSADQNRALSARLSEVERVHNDILQVLGEQSATAATLDATQNR